MSAKSRHRASGGPHTPALDPRLAKHGATRRHPKATYRFPGMMDDRDWRHTRVHQFTSYCGCSRCGQGFTGPHAVYVHLAKVHGA